MGHERAGRECCHGSLVHRPVASVGVAVSGTAVTVASLYVGALTAEDSELVLSPSGALARGSALIASYGLRQQLDAEGDTARVLAVATLSDNTTMLVPHAQLNLSSRTPSLQPVAPDAAGSAPWSVEVATGAVRECGPLLSARWQTCGAVLAEATAELFLQLPEPTAVRISGVHVGGSAAQRGWASGSSLTLAPEGDLATLGGIEVPSSASYQRVHCLLPLCLLCQLAGVRGGCKSSAPRRSVTGVLYST